MPTIFVVADFVKKANQMFFLPHARIQKVLSDGVQHCNTDNTFLGRERGSKYH